MSNDALAARRTTTAAPARSRREDPTLDGLLRFGAVCGVIFGLSLGVPGVIEAFTGETTVTSFIVGLGVAAFAAPALFAFHLHQTVNPHRHVRCGRTPRRDPGSLTQVKRRNRHGSAAATRYQRTDLQQHDLSVPGHEVVQARVDIGPEAPFIKHTHPGEEIIYVLEGSLEYQIEGQAPKTFNAGDALTVPAGAVHAVRNVGSGNAAELATYVVEKGKPILTLVE